MHRPSSIAVSAGLVVLGSLGFIRTAPALLHNKDLDIPLNVMGINRSPYGEVFAMAMQSPIDDYFHAATNGHIHPPGEHHEHGDDDGDHDQADHDHADHDHADHDHDHDGHCDHCDHSHEPKVGKSAPPSSLKGRYRSMLVSLSKVRAVRTNPNPASPKFRFYLRRQIEDKLRFAYQLDPSHYANYNALHFVLTEPQFGTRPELTPSAALLARETIEYCLKRSDDPRPALTAAAACTNVLHLMFADRGLGGTKYSTADMRQILQVLDTSLSRYQTLANEWKATGLWNSLSPLRIQECEERYDFIKKIRRDAAVSITKYESQNTPTPNP